MNEPMGSILILLDNQRDQFDFLKSAAALTRQMKARLQGLFIEEEDLICAADLSFSREISRWSAQERQLTGEGINRILRASARHSKKALEKVAQEEKIECSFQVIRGERISWIKESVNTSDILFIGGKLSNQKNSQYHNSCTRGINALQVIYTGTPASQRALEIAVQIAKLGNRPLVILTIVNEITDELPLREQINTTLINYPAFETSVKIIKTEQLIEALHKLRIFMLVFPSDIKWAQEDNHLDDLLRTTNCPIALVR
jgi:hypothetical protein